jgi:8-oxo-dGTP diphosphatase
MIRCIDMDETTISREANSGRRLPKVGVSAIIIRDGKVLLGKRKGAHGEGSWCFPGGHLEFREEIKDCIKREVMEETGMDIDNIRIAAVTNDVFEKEDKHYITIHTIPEKIFGEPKIMEPDKCEKWEWFEWENLPKPLFVPQQNLLKQGFNPFNNTNQNKK